MLARHIIKRKTADLLTNEKNWQALIRLTDEFDDIGIIVQRDGHYLYANKPLLKRLNMSSVKEIIGMPTLHHVSPEVRKTVFNEFKRLFKQGGSYHAKTLFHQDFRGQDFYEDSRSIPIDYQGNPAILSVSLDITTQKKQNWHYRPANNVFASFIWNPHYPINHLMLMVRSLLSILPGWICWVLPRSRY